MKICIVGANGSIGKRHTSILKKIKPNSNFFLCDMKKSFLDFNQIKNDFFDLVVVCTPTSTHVDIASKFINSNSFFIEKPLDSDINKMKDNLEFFKNKKTMIGCNLLFSKHMNRVKEFLPKSLSATVKAHTFLPKWRENYKELYSSNKKLGGGVLNDYIHEINYITHILGLSNKTTIFKKKLTNYTNDTEDYVLLILEYDDKIVNIELSYTCDSKHRYCDMILKNGERVFVDFSDGIKLPKQHTVSDIDETYEKQWLHFFNNKKPINSYEDSFNLMQMIHNAKIFGDKEL